MARRLYSDSLKLKFVKTMRRKTNRRTGIQQKLEADVRANHAQENKWHDGATATTLMIKNRQLICANVGDSRTVLCRLGQAEPLSEDHKPARPSERDRIIAAGGTISTMGVLRFVHRVLLMPVSFLQLWVFLRSVCRFLVASESCWEAFLHLTLPPTCTRSPCHPTRIRTRDIVSKCID